ncbi:Uncharacterised protein [Actinomyces bovis]|uniref:Bacterial transcriptional activator domain-containing protein n=2 Tax=Actinomyces bovis TaxID=1658 RepID=A0ABY1VNS8_9ACTO|nr:Uncharacterised protein [Actinomyces bovis]VEG55690.1 Uncharacterised protein [Actinomyces israelii]
MLKSLAAAFLLLLVVVGLPVLMLFVLGAPPLPSSLSLSTFTGSLSVKALLGVLEWVIWLAWLQFTACTVTELASAFKANGAPRHLPLSGAVQGLVRRLVITALLVTSVSAPAVAVPAPQLAHAGSGTVSSAQVLSEDASTMASTETAASVEVATTAQGSDGSSTGMAVRYMLGDQVLDPTLGAQLVGKRVYVVQPPEGHYHDNLWDIAERTMGDGRAYREIYELNAGREQPDGLRLELARLIQPNWHLIMPESAVNLPRVMAVPVQAPEPAVPGAEQQGTPEQQGQEAPLSAPQQIDDVMPANLPAVGALTAASLVALLVRRRRLGVWGWPNAEAGELERLLRVGADPKRASRLEEALRYLSQLPTPPAFYAAGVNDQSITLFLSVPMETAPEPWHAEHNGNIWVLDAAADLGGASGAVHVGAGLVTLGRDEMGTDVLVNLCEADGEVVVAGGALQAVEVICALALELCVNPWSEKVKVTGLLLPWTLFQVCGPRLNIVESMEAVLSKQQAEPISGQHRDIEHHIVLTAHPQADQIKSPAPGMTIVRTGSLERARWRIVVDDSGTAKVEPLGVAVRVTRASESDLASLAGLMEDSADPLPPAPISPPPVTTAALASAPLRILLLGKPNVVAPGAVDPERLPVLTEAVACLALHPDGLHPHVLGSLLWPHGVTGDVVQATIDRLRGWLGQDLSGAERLLEDEQGRLKLGSDAVLDVDVLRNLLEVAAVPGAPNERDVLAQALRLVRGPLCQDTPEGHYTWLARSRTSRDVTKLVTKASLRLAELLHDTDPDGAAAAIDVGLSVVELDQGLWRGLFRLAAKQGPDHLAGKVAALLDLTGADDLSLVDPQTAALVEDLAPGRSLGVRRKTA